MHEMLSKYDSKERRQFHFCDIVRELYALDEKTKKSTWLLYELIAFSFYETKNDGYELALIFNPTTGEEILFPGDAQIAKSAIEYWEDRAVESQNPLLRMRYAGLVMAYKKQLIGVEPDFRNIKLGYIESVIEILKGNYTELPLDSFRYCRRAMDMAVAMSKKELAQNIAENLFCYYLQHTTDDFPYLWQLFFEVFIKHYSYFTTIEKRIITDFEERFCRLETLSMKRGRETDKYFHFLRAQAELLSEYYQKKGEKENIQSVLNKTIEALKICIEARGDFWGQGMFSEIQQIYRKYHLHTEANALYKNIYELGEKVCKEKKCLSFPVKIGQRTFDLYFQEVMEGGSEEIIHKFLYYNSLHLSKSRKRYQKAAKENPIYFDLVPMILFNSSGIPLSKIGMKGKAQDLRFNHWLYQELSFLNIFLNIHMQRLIEENILNTDYILNELFKDSPIINSLQRNIIKRGLDAYFEKDYIVTIHLLIPQIESAIRQLAVHVGGDILRPKNNPEDGNEYKSMEGLLSQDCVSAALGEDFTTYFKLLFTDSNAGNWRNLVSHGLLDSEHFDVSMANRVLHAFLLLSYVKEVDIVNE